MIKKRLKPWYPTKEREKQYELTQRLLDAANHLHRTNLTGYGNWVTVGTDVATQLNQLYPGLTTTEAVDYVNTWCGTTTYNPVSYSGVSYYCGTTYTTSFVASASTTTDFMRFSG